MKLTIPTALALLSLASIAASAFAADYDPLRVGDAKAEQKDFVVRDAKRSRDIPVRVFLPAPTTQPAAVVLFSHGLGGNRVGSAYLGEHWAARGYVVVYVQHPGSDDSVWKGKPLAEIMPAMREAANAENFRLRVDDIAAVLNQLDAWNKGEVSLTDARWLEHRLDLSHVGMSGHSFGAVTSQAVGGQSFRNVGAAFTDPRIKAAVMMSPSVPQNGDAKAAFAEVKIPWMLLTGTKDNAPIGGQTPESRRKVFPALPAGDKYELVLDGAEHSAFTDRPLPGDREKRNPNHHRAILAVTTAFWDAYLHDDAAARAWLDDNASVRAVLEHDDAWQRK